jgi:hypothetical protein
MICTFKFESPVSCSQKTIQWRKGVQRLQWNPKKQRYVRILIELFEEYDLKLCVPRGD